MIYLTGPRFWPPWREEWFLTHVMVRILNRDLACLVEADVAGGQDPCRAPSHRRHQRLQGQGAVPVATGPAGDGAVRLARKSGRGQD
jgi:hypothetical protein